MTTATVHRLQRVERAALIVAVLALIIAVVLAVRAPHDVVPAWRLALFICLQPALGSLVFILIYRLTGGQWMEGLAPFLLAGARMLPWIWVLILPLLWFPMAAHLLEVWWLVLPSVSDRLDVWHFAWLLPLSALGLAVFCHGLLALAESLPAREVRHA